MAHWPDHGTSRVPERGVDGEDLAVTDVCDRPRLGGPVAGDGDGHVDVHDLGRLRVRQVLRGRPHDRPPGGALQRLDGGPEAAAAEQEQTVGADAGHDLEVPPQRVVRRAQAEELTGVHRPRW